MLMNILTAVYGLDLNFFYQNLISLKQKFGFWVDDYDFDIWFSKMKMADILEWIFDFFF